MRKFESLKHAKVRANSKYIQIHACIDNVRYRFSTKMLVSAKNLLWVEKHYKELVEKKQKEAQKYNGQGFTIGNYGEDIIYDYCKDLKETTYLRYRNVFEKYIMPKIGDYQIAFIRPKHANSIFIEKFRDVSYANKKIILCVLKMIFTHAIYDELVDTNPFLHIRIKNNRNIIPKQRENIPFSEDEMKNILANCKDYFLKLYCYIAFFTGMRPNEILALTKNDIDLDKNMISVNKSVCNGEISTTKTGKTRKVEIIQPLRVILRDLQVDNKSEYLFEWNKRRFTHSMMSYRFKKLLAKLNIKKNTMYSMRHSFATAMLQGGEELTWIQSQLGHQSLQTTLTHYIKHVDNKKKRGMYFMDMIDEIQEVS